MNTKVKTLTRREIAILLTLVFGLLIAYPAVRSWQQHTAQRQYTPCEQQLLRVDAIIAQIAGTNRIGLTNFANVDALKPYITSGEVPHCPEGGIIRISMDSRLATVCTKYGPVMQPTPEPANKSILDAFQWYRRRHVSAGNPCIANLKQMDGAAQQWALENRKDDKDEIDIMGAASYLKGGVLPVCPQGGKYWFTVLSNPPCCTIIGHSLP